MKLYKKNRIIGFIVCALLSTSIVVSTADPKNDDKNNNCGQSLSNAAFYGGGVCRI